MAIDYLGAAFLLSVRRRKIPLGRVLTLGRQHLVLSEEMISSLESQFAVDLRQFVKRAGEEVFAEPFLEYVGAEEVTSLDFCDYEGSSLSHDLNEPVPDSWKGRYDFVIDGGTLEHVFNFPTAIGNAMELVAEGGCFLGCNPANNWLGHGFYQFGPELFFRTFTPGNGFEVIDVLLAEDAVGGAIYKVRDPAEAGTRISLDSRQRVCSVVFARRTKVLAGLPVITPQQSDYTSRWTEEDGGEGAGTGQAGWRAVAKGILPRRLVQWVQERAIERRHREEGSRGLQELDSMAELQ